MCPPCVIWTTHNAVCASCHSETICTDLCFHRCVTALCVWQILRSFCEAVTWSLYVLTDTQKSPFDFSIFCVGCRSRSLVPDKHDYFLFWREEWCCREVGLLLSLRSTPAPPCLLVLSSLFLMWRFYLLCPLCGPKVHRNPTQHCHVKSKSSQAVNVAVLVFLTLR